MTWKEFKQVVEDAGVKDEHELEYIDVSFPDAFSLDVDITGDHDFTVTG